ncbi:hypothetical protein KIW84_042162 [Lathyrus oleraceus]|uniref:DUF7745 domain-containing protein n=1 Tax=Pisum sativum TaxID=3888 RepID=A0A9D4XBU9_PEA|nr:hypothetical protein KIW84_042162 [Pisum sativum]
MSDLQNLKVLQGLMPNSTQRKFTLKYGRTLDLLRVPVKVEVVTALAQFYDPPLSFPNVPLIGSKGCSNYIPILDMRQLGHPVWEKPEKGDLAGFILHNEDTIPQNFYDLEQKDKQLLESQKEIKTERSKRQKTLGGLLGVGFNLETVNKKLKEAQAEGQRWKRSWELDMWDQQERENTLATQIHRLEKALAKS